MRLAFIVKSTIKNKERFYEEAEAIKNTHLPDSVQVFETEYAGHAIELAKKAVNEKFDYIISVGGDGTLHEVINGVLSSDADADELPAVGLLPYGSANDFSRALAISRDMKQLFSRIETNRTRYIDIGEVFFNDEEGNHQSRYFINILDAGIGALVVKKVNNSPKRLGTNIAFLKAITESFLTYSPSRVTSKIDGREIDSKLLTLVVANGNFFGNGLCIAPDAKVDDNAFQAVLLEDISVPDYLFNLRKLKKKERIEHKKVHYFKGRNIELIPQDYSVSIEADGEFLGYAPMTVRLHHNRIRIIHQQKTE